MIFIEQPKDFNPVFCIASCFLEHNGKILMLQRPAGKRQELKWGLPAGKIEGSENETDAVQREIYEETGMHMLKKKLNYFGRVFVRYDDYDFVFHIFHSVLPEAFDIKLSSEHIDFKWIRPDDALKLPLVQELDACIRLFYKI